MWTSPTRSALGRANGALEGRKMKWISPFPTQQTFRVVPETPAAAETRDDLLLLENETARWTLVPSGLTRLEGAGAPVWEDRDDGKPSVEAAALDHGLPIVEEETDKFPETLNPHERRLGKAREEGNPN